MGVRAPKSRSWGVSLLTARPLLVLPSQEATFVSRLMRAPRDANVAVTETLAQKVPCSLSFCLL